MLSRSSLSSADTFGVDIRIAQQVDEIFLGDGRCVEGDLVVIAAGSPPGIPGSTNALRVHKIGDAKNRVAPAYEDHEKARSAAAQN